MPTEYTETKIGIDSCQFYVREGTNDADVVRSVFQGEYAVPDGTKPPQFAASIDVGAHIGAFSVWAGHVYKYHDVLAIEPLSENIELLIRNSQLNNSGIYAHQGAVGSGSVSTVDVHYMEGSEMEQRHRFIGNGAGMRAAPECATVRRFTLADLFQCLEDRTGNKTVWTLKLDCEGGEYPLIAEASISDLQRCKWILGEYHEAGVEPLNRLLDCGFTRRTSVEGHFCFENTVS